MRNTIMPRALSALAILALSGTASYSHDNDRVRWDGAIRIVSATQQCSQVFFPGNQPATLHLRFDNDDPESAFTRFGKGETEMIRTDNSGQFNGTGHYDIDRISGGIIFQSHQSQGAVAWQMYSFVQSPAVATPTTPFVSLIGRLDNYNDIIGCTLQIRGSFVRVDPEVGQ